tara:strand:+ start:311 stop:421 length:111 start_codon:yes stop_codon:yes gene_type:complete
MEEEFALSSEGRQSTFLCSNFFPENERINEFSVASF